MVLLKVEAMVSSFSRSLIGAYSSQNIRKYSHYPIVEDNVTGEVAKMAAMELALIEFCQKSDLCENVLWKLEYQ